MGLHVVASQKWMSFQEWTWEGFHTKDIEEKRTGKSYFPAKIKFSFSELFQSAFVFVMIERRPWEVVMAMVLTIGRDCRGGSIGQPW